MLRKNRLINDFKKQSKTTIWKHLDAMAANYAVYSTHLKNMPPYLDGYDLYLYCNDTNIVLVCLDSCGHGEDQIYSESPTLNSLIYEDGKEPRVSTVWLLERSVNFIRERFDKHLPRINVFGVLLTEAEILNSYLMYDIWEAHHVMVIDEMTKLKNRTIRVNEDRYLDCKDYVAAILDTSDDATAQESSSSFSSSTSRNEDKTNNYDKDFEELLDEFINGMDDEKKVNTTDTQTDSVENTPLPDGDIEQNPNINVRVEILRPIANPREELDKMVGCDNIKQRMEELVSLSSYNQMKQELFPDSKPHEVSLHSVFLGRPGTGKTTVCKIFGSLLRQAGVLSKGHVVVCNRGTFIGTLWGDEERSMQQVLEMAQGGVLMFDEAYLLNGKNDNDPGKLVIQLLMNILADETQRDIAVVLCGYKEPMMKLLDMNPGLQSRFPNKFEFTDFTVDELLEITRQRIKDYGYQFTKPAWEKFKTMLSQAYLVRNQETWGNARFIANQLERIYIRHAARCVRQRPKNKRDLLKLTPEDIVPIEIPRQKTKIGF